MLFYIYLKLLLNNIAKKNQVKIFQNDGVIHGGLGCLATGVVEQRARQFEKCGFEKTRFKVFARYN